VRGPTRIFRGAELPRLLVLAAILVVGWGIVLTSGRPQAEPSRPATGAETPPLPPADAAPVFAGVTDKTPMKLGDMAAYAALLERVRTTPRARLAARCRRDVLFSQLLDRPGRYRGLPIHLQGTAKRILIHDEVQPELSSRGRLHEAWVFTDDSQGFPYVLVFEAAPPGLPVGNDVNELVAFDGYFLKLMAYQAADGPRVAPLLIGRLGWSPPQREAAPTVLGLPRHALRWVVAVLFLLTTLRLLSWALRTRRTLGPPLSRPRGPAPIDQIDPEDLSAWLAGAAEDDPEAGAGDDPGTFPRPAT
jgi:hypothetical protein